MTVRKGPSLTVRRRKTSRARSESKTVARVDPGASSELSDLPSDFLEAPEPAREVDSTASSPAPFDGAGAINPQAEVEAARGIAAAALGAIVRASVARIIAARRRPPAADVSMLQNLLGMTGRADAMRKVESELGRTIEEARAILQRHDSLSLEDMDVHQVAKANNEFMKWYSEAYPLEHERLVAGEPDGRGKTVPETTPAVSGSGGNPEVSRDEDEALSGR
jgi:hypothetical protein